MPVDEIGHTEVCFDGHIRYTLAAMPECNPSIYILGFFDYRIANSSRMFIMKVGMQLGTGMALSVPLLGNRGDFWALVIPHTRPTLFQMFSSAAHGMGGSLDSGAREAQARLTCCGRRSHKADSMLYQ